MIASDSLMNTFKSELPLLSKAYAKAKNNRCILQAVDVLLRHETEKQTCSSVGKAWRKGRHRQSQSPQGNKRTSPRSRYGAVG
jgi:hypothetical protein